MEASERNTGNPYEPHPGAQEHKGLQEHQEATWRGSCVGSFFQKWAQYRSG